MYFSVTTYVSAPGDAEVMQRMKETIDTQRDVIRSRNLEIESQKADVEAVSTSGFAPNINVLSWIY